MKSWSCDRSKKKHIFVPTPVMESNLSPAILRFYPYKTQNDRPSFAVNESVPKSRPCWAAHTRFGFLGKYSLHPGMTHPRGSGYCSKLHLQKWWKRYLGQPEGKILATPLICSRSWAKISLNWSPKVRSGTEVFIWSFTRCCSWEVSRRNAGNEFECNGRGEF